MGPAFYFGNERYRSCDAPGTVWIVVTKKTCSYGGGDWRNSCSGPLLRNLAKQGFTGDSLLYECVLKALAAITLSGCLDWNLRFAPSVPGQRPTMPPSE